MSLFCFLMSYVCLFKFLAVLDLHCCVLAFSSCGERGYPVVEAQGLLTVGASLVEQYRLQGVQALVVVARGLRSWGSRLLELRLSSVAHGLSRPTAYKVFQNHGWNCCPLHCKLGS